MAALSKSDKTALKREISLLANLIEGVTNGLSSIKDFYTGRSEAVIPPENMWLEKLVDTSTNGIDKALKNIVPRLKRNDRINYPKKALDKVQKAVSALFDKLTLLTAGNEHFKDGQLLDTSSHITEFINYLNGEMHVIGATPHDLRIDHYVEKMRHFFRDDAKAFYLLTFDRIAAKNQSADVDLQLLRNPEPRKRRGIGGRRRQTEFMKIQLDTLSQFVRTRSCEQTTGNIYALALQCWYLNQAQWEPAKLANGHNKGYSSPKYLAAAWLKYGG